VEGTVLVTTYSYYRLRGIYCNIMKCFYGKEAPPTHQPDVLLFLFFKEGKGPVTGRVPSSHPTGRRHSARCSSLKLF
jgi:hypothetical protein